MRILRAGKVIEAEAGLIDSVRAGRPVVIDVGAGDGRFVYEMARKDHGSLYIALDPDADALAEYAYKASRKPARGGAENTLFVVASVEQLPPELVALADKVYVIFPWGGLLRGIIRPEPSVLEAITRLAAVGCRFEIVLAYDPTHDAAVLEGEALPDLDYVYIDGVLLPTYAQAGLQVTGRRRLPQAEALAIPSTWGRRLLHGRPREAYAIRGLIMAKPTA